MTQSLGSLTMGSMTLAAGDAYVLVSWWKAILLMVPFIGWAWVISTILDKHAQRFFLGQEKWNLIHMIFGVGALALVVLLPMGGMVGLLVAFFGAAVILGIDIIVFASIANKDDRIPEHAKLTLNMSDMAAKREEKKAAKKLGSSELTIVGADKMKIAPPDKESTGFAVRLAAEEIIINSHEARASQVDILPINAETYGVSMLVDGVRQPGEQLAKADAIQIIDFWKNAAGLDVEDRRRKQGGSVDASSESISPKTVKCVTSGSKNGMVLTMIFNPDKAVRREPSELGMTNSQLEMAKDWAQTTEGIVLLAAQSDNGRTTSMYSMLKLHDAYTSNIQTIEYEIEDAIEGVKQIVFDQTSEEADFATTVRSSLRRDPDVVGVCDLPDAPTAKNIAISDYDRTRVYLSLKSDDALNAIQLYVRGVGDAKLAAQGLSGVIAQKLLRCLCNNCKVAYQPTPEMLKKLGLPSDKVKQLFKKGGQVLIRNKPEICPACNGVGYEGQTGCFGVFPIGDEERKMIAAENWTGLRTAMRKRSLPTVQQAALRKAVEGITSIEEVSRISSSSKSKKSGGGGSSGSKAASSKPQPA
jgi:type II secretory ATPase GspE/PulE/Tfp pilus assembly ATPase PilB-like protein